MFCGLFVLLLCKKCPIKKGMETRDKRAADEETIKVKIFQMEDGGRWKQRQENRIEESTTQLTSHETVDKPVAVAVAAV
jgi:hypothetical protein